MLSTVLTLKLPLSHSVLLLMALGLAGCRSKSSSASVEVTHKKPDAIFTAPKPSARAVRDSRPEYTHLQPDFSGPVLCPRGFDYLAHLCLRQCPSDAACGSKEKCVLSYTPGLCM